MSNYKTKYFTVLQRGKYSIKIKPGTYQFECWGAQGGAGAINAEYYTEGGKCAYTSGEITFNESITLFLFVGGKGEDGPKEKMIHAKGGFNGGGTAGCDTTDDDASGGGGGATDIRLVDGEWSSSESLYSRIIVAGGGSGSAFKAYGAPGGEINGFMPTQIGNDHYTISTTSQTQGFKLGRGADGTDSSATPSSGAGGGYWGGIEGTPTQQGMSESSTYRAVSSSGSSFILGHPGCIPTNENGEPVYDEDYNSKYRFCNTVMAGGLKEFYSPLGVIEKGHSGDGAIIKSVLTKTPYVQPCKTMETCNFSRIYDNAKICSLFNICILM